MEMLEKVLQYCRFVDRGMNDGKEDIKGDLVDTGIINGTGKLLEVPKDCDDAKDVKQDIENFKDMLNDAFTLNKMDK